jgi:predicted nucleic acid-binding protein
MIVEVTEIVTDYRDWKDNKFLGLAVSVAKCMVSGD